MRLRNLDRLVMQRIRPCTRSYQVGLEVISRGFTRCSGPAGCFTRRNFQDTTKAAKIAGLHRASARECAQRGPCPDQACFMTYPTIESVIGHTPLVRLQRLPGQTSNTLLVKLEGNNPAGSVKDRPALSMISRAEARGEIEPGDTLIEATSGNTGIALAMVAAVKGYRMILIMPDNATDERKAAMTAYGAELILVSREASMEGARDLAEQMAAEGKGKLLDQFANDDNPAVHYATTGPELWEQTAGRITHLVSSMGTTGTIVGTSRYLKEKNSGIEIVGLQPAEGSSIPGIRRWPTRYLPRIYDDKNIDRVVTMSQERAEHMMRELARREGIFCGVSSGGAVAAALELSQRVENATIVAVICDRGDRYLSSGVFNV